MANRSSQIQRLIFLYRERKGGWVTLPEIQRLGIAQQGARHTQLREMGFVIENKMERSADGTTVSSYRVVFDPGDKATAKKNQFSQSSQICDDSEQSTPMQSDLGLSVPEARYIPHYLEQVAR